MHKTNIYFSSPDIFSSEQPLFRDKLKCYFLYTIHFSQSDSIIFRGYLTQGTVLCVIAFRQYGAPLLCERLYHISDAFPTEDRINLTSGYEKCDFGIRACEGLRNLSCIARRDLSALRQT